MSTAPATLHRLWRTVITHWPARTDLSTRPCCPICKRRRCRPWAEAFGDLVAADEWHKGPPPDIDRPHKPTGVSRRNSMKWKTLRCDNSGPNCPEIAEADGMVYLRDSERPLDVVAFTPEGFEVLKRKIRDGEV